MARARVLPLIISSIVANIKLCGVLIDSEVGLNILTTYAFDELWIPYDKLTPGHPFLGSP